MKLKLFQVDAFAGRPFEGNPAAVVPLDRWPDDQLMQAIAGENNLSETAFFVPSADGFELRWFTPTTEVDLCGHATLATAHVIFEHLGDHLGHDAQSVRFATRSGELRVQRNGQLLQMDFPARPPRFYACPEALFKGLGLQPVELLAADDYLAVFDDEEMVRAIEPDHALLSQLELRGVIVTAPGREVDFVSRFFAPKFGIPEDPVTGSAHCQLAPYWAERLGKELLNARQISRRGGDITCELKGDRVLLSGSAVTFLTGEIVL